MDHEAQRSRRRTLRGLASLGIAVCFFGLAYGLFLLVAAAMGRAVPADALFRLQAELPSDAPGLWVALLLLFVLAALATFRLRRWAYRRIDLWLHKSPE